MVVNSWRGEDAELTSSCLLFSLAFCLQEVGSSPQLWVNLDPLVGGPRFSAVAFSARFSSLTATF